MNTMVVLSVIDIVLLIAGLSIYLYFVGTQLTRIATNLEECSELVKQIVRDAEPIIPGVEHINRTGGVVAGALPLLYDMAEGIVTGVTPAPEHPAVRGPAVPASGRRRSRLHEGVGYVPGSSNNPNNPNNPNNGVPSPSGSTPAAAPVAPPS